MFAAPPEMKTNNILIYFMVQTNNVIQYDTKSMHLFQENIGQYPAHKFTLLW